MMTLINCKLCQGTMSPLSMGIAETAVNNRPVRRDNQPFSSLVFLASRICCFETIVLLFSA